MATPIPLCLRATSAELAHARAWRAADGHHRIVLTLAPSFPVELSEALGYLTVDLLAEPLRGQLDEWLELADLVIVEPDCRPLLGEATDCPVPIHELDPPVCGEEHELFGWAARLEQLVATLESVASRQLVPIDLHAAMSLVEHHAELALRLVELHRTFPDRLPPRRLRMILDRVHTMRRIEHCTWLATEIARLSDREPGSFPGRAQVFVATPPCARPSPALLDAVTASGLGVVEPLALAPTEAPFARSSDPWKRLAGRSLRRAACDGCRGHAPRLEQLRGLAASGRLNGIVLTPLPPCRLAEEGRARLVQMLVDTGLPGLELSSPMAPSDRPDRVQSFADLVAGATRKRKEHSA